MTGEHYIFKIYIYEDGKRHPIKEQVSMITNATLLYNQTGKSKANKMLPFEMYTPAFSGHTHYDNRLPTLLAKYANDVYDLNIEDMTAHMYEGISKDMFGY